MSAPAAKYASWIARTDVGLRDRQQVVVALEVVRVMAEAARGGPAEVGLRELALLDLRAHRAVQDQDAAVKERGDLGGAVRLHGGSVLHRAR
jgi:hypothetical protein